MGDGRPPVVVMADGGLAGWVAMALEAERAVASGHGPIVAASTAVGPSVHAVERQAAGLGAHLLTLPQADLDDLHPGAAASVLLIRAGAVAGELGAGRVVWPIALGADLDASDAVEAVAREADRALLAARLVSIDLAGAGVEIDTPLVDLDDRQIAELALDLGLPLEGAEVVGARRWSAALADLGWGGRPGERLHDPTEREAGPKGAPSTMRAL